MPPQQQRNNRVDRFHRKGERQEHGQGRHGKNDSSSRCSQGVTVLDMTGSCTYGVLGNKMAVPWHKCYVTKGLQNAIEHMQKKNHLSTLCKFFTDTATCPYGPTCFKIHVHADYVEKVRTALQNGATPCCGAHNDEYTKEVLTSVPHLNTTRLVEFEDGRVIPVPVKCLSLTYALEPMPEYAQATAAWRTRVIPSSRICRLHLQGTCKWHKDCSQVHICREFFASIQQGAPAVDTVQQSLPSPLSESPVSEGTKEEAPGNEATPLRIISIKMPKSMKMNGAKDTYFTLPALETAPSVPVQ
jgi:hypothetical protein